LRPNDNFGDQEIADPDLPLSISGQIDLTGADLSRYIADVLGNPKSDYSKFSISIEDSKLPIIPAFSDGKFSIQVKSVSEQTIIRISHCRFPQIQFLWMTVNSQIPIRRISARISIETTAGSLIAKMVRDRFGKLLDPSMLSSEVVKPVVEAINAYFAGQDEISSITQLEDVPRINSAVASIATNLQDSSMTFSPRDWTVLIYQGGDNTLESSLAADRKEMMAATMSSKVAVVVQIDDSSYGMRRLQIKNGQEYPIMGLGSGNSADADRFSDFIGWGMRVFPARRYAVIAASHGLGWRTQSASRGIISDDNAGLTMNLSNLNKAFAEAMTLPGSYSRKMDLIGFDACYMGSLEVAYQLRKYGNYMVFSQAFEPADGWPYDLILNELSINSSVHDGESWGKCICTNYRDSYEKEAPGILSGTLSLINLCEIESFGSVFAGWAKMLYENSSTTSSVLSTIRDSKKTSETSAYVSDEYALQAFDIADYRDLSILVKSVGKSFPKSSLSSDEILSSWHRIVPYAVQFGPRYTEAAGLSVSLPASTTFNDYINGMVYGDLELSRDTNWDEIISGINFAEESSSSSILFTVTLSSDDESEAILLLGTTDESNGRLLWEKLESASERRVISRGEKQVPCMEYSISNIGLDNRYYLVAYEPSDFLRENKLFEIGTEIRLNDTEKKAFDFTISPRQLSVILKCSFIGENLSVNTLDIKDLSENDLKSLEKTVNAFEVSRGL